MDAVLYWKSLIDGRFFNRGTNEGVCFREMLKEGSDGEFGMIGMCIGIVDNMFKYGNLIFFFGLNSYSWQELKKRLILSNE